MRIHATDGNDHTAVRRRNPLTRFLDRHLIGKNDPAKFSDVWRKNFEHHPTWCDADMALQQINAGNATGNTIALYSRAFFQRILYCIGEVVQIHPWKIITCGLLALLVCCFGLQYVVIETDIVKLWVSQGGRLDEELSYRSRIQSEYHHRQKRSAPASPIVPAEVVSPKPPVPATRPEIPQENGLGGGFQVVIQTPEADGSNILTKEGLLQHVKIMEEISKYTVFMYGENWTLADICFKPPPPKFGQGGIWSSLEDLLERIIPCIWITPIDCFWEGSKPLGPHPGIKLQSVVRTFLPELPEGDISWKNLDPLVLIESTKRHLDIHLDTVENFFNRAGIGHAYVDRKCIDPLDPECPKDAPNHFDRCLAYDSFTAWQNTLPPEERVHLAEEIFTTADDDDANIDLVSSFIGGRRKRQAVASNSTKKAASGQKAKNGTKTEDYYDYTDPDEVKTTPRPVIPKVLDCKKFGKSFLQWMDKNPNKWSDFMSKEHFPIYPDYGLEMSGGCLGFGKNIMKWPEDLIIGGVKREAGRLEIAEAFQSVFLVAGANDVYNRIRGAKSAKPNLDVARFTVGQANDIIQAWQRNFTSKIYDHPLNHVKDRQRVIHPLASTSINDMLKEFSEFKFFVIFVGYVLMVIYAGWSQLDWDGMWFSTKSATGLAILGVLMVTYSSIAGLGLSSMMGVNFNAATTQIVPFLTLGLGIDDVFLILHNYQGVVYSVNRKEVAVLMKETGMSILITSINNVLAFLTGIILPIPALRSFCTQTAILLLFNLFSVMFMYPAFIALDLRRRKAGIRDLTPSCGTYVLCGKPTETKLKGATESTNQLVDNNVDAASNTAKILPQSFSPSNPSETPKWYTLEGFLKGYYIPLLKNPLMKGAVLIVCIAMFAFGLVGLYRSKLGLELSDVLPEQTPPAAFLRAREKYFSFYPMYVVLKELDLPNQQLKIEDLRKDIAKSDFVIKVDGKPSEPYWMLLMRVWLSSIQTELDKAIAIGAVDLETGKVLQKNVSENARIARRLICSYGLKFNCTGRFGTNGVKLVSEGVINPEGFYNYLTAWFNLDNMMYYVSQAAFFPSPPAWAFKDEDLPVPPAEPLRYSQVPFYLTGLIDTPPIVEMIKEVRAVCEEYTRDGLPVFPTGIAFTFWEQYLELEWNLFLAILVIASAVLLVISLLIFNPWAAAMVAIVVVSMTVMLAGFMGLCGVKLNPISAVTLITAVGIGVEFTAHVVLAFLTSLGTRNDRMASCMEHMFVPVIHGGLSTLLGIVMLAFSEFDFVVKYFFVVMTALIVIGLINGLALLPVLLSLIGPPCEIRPIDGGKTLPVPKSRKRAGSISKVPIVVDPVTDEISNGKKGKKVKKNTADVSSTEESSDDGSHVYHEELSTIAEESEASRRSPFAIAEVHTAPDGSKKGNKSERF